MGRRMLALWCVGGVLALIPCRVNAEDLGGDRPDFTESPVSVPAGMIQIEFGAIWERTSSSLEALDAPELLIRWGLGYGWEARFEVPGLVRLRGAMRESARSDGALGFKRELGEVLPATEAALLVMASVPVGETWATSDRVDPLVALTWERELGPGWALGGQTTAAWPSEDRDRELNLGQTLVLAHDLTPGWGTFLELAGERPRGGRTALLLHQGVTRAVGRRGQVDVHWGVGLNRHAPNYFVGAGYIQRF